MTQKEHTVNQPANKQTLQNHGQVSNDFLAKNEWCFTFDDLTCNADFDDTTPVPEKDYKWYQFQDKQSDKSPIEEQEEIEATKQLLQLGIIVNDNGKLRINDGTPYKTPVSQPIQQNINYAPKFINNSQKLSLDQLLTAPTHINKAPNNLFIGRNEKCPCGSGKKFKKCCG